MSKSKPETEDEVTMAICYSTMSSWQFNYARRLQWEIWAAKYRPCSACSVGPQEQCVNLSDINAGRAPLRLNKRPHAERIDWGRLLSGLKQRGYYRPAIEAQVRRYTGL